MSIQLAEKAQPTKWLEGWMALAEAGDARANIELGWEFYRGGLVDRDLVEAERRFRLADATAPDVGAYNLFKMHYLLGDKAIHDLFAERVWSLGAIYYVYAHFRRREGASKPELQKLFEAGALRGHLLSRIRSHQLSSSLVERMLRMPAELRLIWAALRIKWRNPEDPRVLE